MPTTPTPETASDRCTDIPVLVLNGPPGAGKSTAMRALRRQFPSLTTFGVRVFFERQAEEGTSLGLKAKEATVHNRWYPDDIIVEGLISWLDENVSSATYIVLEGSFPHNRELALALERALGSRGLRVHRMVYLDVPDAVCTERVTNREVCVNCETSVADAIPVPGSACTLCGRQLVRRPDDNLQNFRERLARHRESAVELLAHYESLGVAVRIDGTAPPAQVAAALEAAAPAARAERDDLADQLGRTVQAGR
ncbi:adenylate kinase family protein [Streptomyces sp. NBC_01435]|uniref:adenylate kinase family protein n=1 Tax=Streptomyces sp. NBC_01435 TaxID=2903865 RepID=UPI002E3229D3|nr:nucleoside monophosphate kinase [Streptomyces sp. NBC_01435]